MSRRLHGRAVDAKRHAHCFRARDVGGGDVVDVADRPAQAIDALSFVYSFERVEEVGHGGVVDHMLVDVPAGARCRGGAGLAYSFMISAGQGSLRGARSKNGL